MKMPTRLRNTGSAGDAQKDQRYDIPGLDFGDTLTWRAGKPISVADLLTRLQKLASELRNFDLDQVDSRAFNTLAHDLANANLLAHKDKGVRAWTIACIVDVLKICAPDAPFLEGQLKVSMDVESTHERPQLTGRVGHLYGYNQLNPSCSCGSDQRIQCPACVHLELVGRIAKYIAGDRHPKPRESDDRALHDGVRHCIWAYEQCCWSGGFKKRGISPEESSGGGCR